MSAAPPSMRFFVRRFWLVIPLLLLTPLVIEAQLFVCRDITTCRLVWNAPTSGGTPRTYHVKCRVESGTYNLPVVDVAVPRTELKVGKVVSSPGTYYCAVTASNRAGESGPSNEVSFKVE